MNVKMRLLVIFCVLSTIKPQEWSGKVEEALCKLECYNDIIPTCSINQECNCSQPLEGRSDSLSFTEYSKSDVKLKCRAQDMFHVEWETDMNPFGENKTNTAYFLYVQTPDEEYFTDVIFCNYHTVRTSPNTTYTVTLWGVDDKSRSFVSGPLTVSTPEEGKIPLPVTNVSLELIPDRSHFQAEIQWRPALDISCYYDVVLYCTDLANDFDVMRAPESFEVADPSELFHLRIEELNFGHSYAITVRAQSANLESESTNKTIYFDIPTCLAAFRNLTICAPEEPKNLTATEFSLQDSNEDGYNIFDIELNWEKPELIPDYYIAKMIIASTDLKTVMALPTMNISGNATSATFAQVNVSSYYQIFLRAISEGGDSTPAAADRLSIIHRHISRTENLYNFKTIFFITGLVGTILILSLLTIPIRYRRLRVEVSKTENKYVKDGDKGVNQIEKIHHTDKWELPIESVNFKTILGEGAFGVVWQGTLDNKPVACKTLKDNCTADEVRQLQQEIEIMKYVGSHPNIVSMIGCITCNVPNGPILVVEYCSNGNLLDYLRNIYNNIVSRLGELEKDGMQKGSNDYSNRLYELNVNMYEEQTFLSQTEIISYGRQIAMGMEYLCSQKVLHRDLAARNILMCDDKKVKVSDFGLSRDVYMDSVYYKTTNGKLPVRWMALESLTHQIYTSQSDVWSFGILLWEIVTLGAVPYGGIETHDLLARLKCGERMTKPHLCPDEIYSLMLKCWKESPIDRPTFSSLRAELEDLLANEMHYLELNTKV